MRLSRFSDLLLIRALVAIFFFALGLGPLPAQITPPPLDGKIAIKAGRMLDVRTGAVVADVVVLAEKDRIVSVGKTAPADATVIED